MPESFTRAYDWAGRREDFGDKSIHLYLDCSSPTLDRNVNNFTYEGEDYPKL